MTTPTATVSPIDPATEGRHRRPPGGARAPGRPRDERATRSILDAALEQLDEVGFGRMTLDSVAVAAGVSRATVYRRFDGKADLVTTAIAEQVSASAPVPTGDTRHDLVRALADFEQRFGEDCLEVVGGLRGLREEPEAMELHRRRVIRPRTAYVRDLLVQAQVAGLLPAGTDVELALQMLLGAVLARRMMGVDPDPAWAATAVSAIFAPTTPITTPTPTIPTPRAPTTT